MTEPVGPARRPDVTSAQIGTESIVYDPATGVAHRLNSTAVLVWDCCDGGTPIDVIIAELADALGESPDAIGPSVRAVIRRFGDHGLLAGAPPPAARPAASDHPPVATAEPAPAPGGRSRLLGPYRALGTTVVVTCCDHDGVADHLERMLGPLATTTGPSAPDPVAFTVWKDDRWHVDIDGQRRHTAADASAVADTVMFDINWLAFRQPSNYLVVHAAAVARDGVAVVMPALAGAGKSTLTAALVAAGFDYLTDEAAAIDLDTGTVIGYPKPITLDPGSQHLLPGLEPSRPSGRSSKWHVVPDDVRSGSAVERARIGHLVFPTHVPGADNRLVPIDTIDATVALVSHASDLAVVGHRLAELAAFVDRCTRHTLLHDGIEAPVAAIGSLR